MRILITLVLVSLAGLISGPAFSQALQKEVIKAKDNLYFTGDRTYSAFYITDEGVIVIDPLDSANAAFTMQAIRSLTKKPVTYVFYSHNHWDHISGARVFKDQGAKIVSHQKAADNIAPNPDVLMPDSTWQGDYATFTYGGHTIELYYYGYNHGNGMTVFRFPQHNAVFIIDLVVPDRVLYAYLPDASPRNWVQHLQEIQKLDFDEAYFSHLRAIGDRSDLTLMQNYFRDLYAAVEQALNDGTPFFDIPQSVKLPQYSHLKNYDTWLHMNVWRILMEKSIGQ
ncbi:MBL fold metallo-hydrolase [Roseivirga sp. BDSF3-8]|uniref:MBL fold metallo-hydrolase n=1 Tax=Roseivirga sp. BDSF3-8 TaxID=3241598 RepID=UPI003531CDDE